MTNLETTQKINANKIFTCTRREFTPEFKAMVVKEYEAGSTRKELAKNTTSYHTILLAGNNEYKK